MYMYNLPLQLLHLLLCFTQAASCHKRSEHHNKIHPHQRAEERSENAHHCISSSYVPIAHLPNIAHSSRAQTRSPSPRNSMAYMTGRDRKHTMVILEGVDFFRPSDPIFHLDLATRDVVNKTLQELNVEIRNQSREGRAVTLKSHFIIVGDSFRRMNKSIPGKVTSRAEDDHSSTLWWDTLRTYQGHVLNETRERPNVAQGREHTSGISSARPTGASGREMSPRSNPTITLLRFSVFGFFLMTFGHGLYAAQSSLWSSLELIIETILFTILFPMINTVVDDLEANPSVNHIEAYVLYHLLSALLTVHGLIELGWSPRFHPPGFRETSGILRAFGIAAQRPNIQASSDTRTLLADSIVPSTSNEGVVSGMVSPPSISLQDQDK